MLLNDILNLRRAKLIILCSIDFNFHSRSAAS